MKTDAFLGAFQKFSVDIMSQEQLGHGQSEDQNRELLQSMSVTKLKVISASNPQYLHGKFGISYYMRKSAHRIQYPVFVLFFIFSFVKNIDFKYFYSSIMN